MMNRRKFTAGGLVCATGVFGGTQGMACQSMETDWQYVADTVMGGVSTGTLNRTAQDGRAAARLTGMVSLDNNGGFIQMAFNPGGSQPYDASQFGGITFQAKGNGEKYDISLRTTDLRRPWQSYRAGFVAGPTWQQVTLPFSDFVPNSTDAPLNPARLRRIGVLAVGRVFEVDVSISDMCFIA